MPRNILLILLILFCSACEEYKLDPSETNLGYVHHSDWYIVGLHCDDKTVAGIHDAVPLFDFNQDDYYGPHYIGNNPIPFFMEDGVRKKDEYGKSTYGEYFFELFNSTDYHKFTLLKFTYTDMVLLDHGDQFFNDDEDGKAHLFPEYDFCWITLEAR